MSVKADSPIVIDGEVILFDHAISNYVKRVLGEPEKSHHPNKRHVARRAIERAYRNPFRVENFNRSSAPIYFGEKVAIPVDYDKEGYKRPVIPSAYHRNNYTDDPKYDTPWADNQ